MLDTSYRGTAVGVAARGLACPVEWHDGFVASVDDILAHPDFRGPEIVALATRLAVDGELTPRVIAAAARTGR